MQLELTRQQLEELQAVLEDRLSELAEEIYHADVSDYHDQLKRRKAVLEEITKKVEAAAASRG